MEIEHGRRRVYVGRSGLCYLAMIALVNFAEHVIERPRLAKRDHRSLVVRKSNFH